MFLRAHVISHMFFWISLENLYKSQRSIVEHKARKEVAAEEVVGWYINNTKQADKKKEQKWEEEQITA